MELSLSKKSDLCSCSGDLGSTATSGSPLWRVGDGRVPCGGRYHAKFQSPPYLEIRVDLFKLLFNSWPCFAIVFNLFFFFKAYPNTINYWMKHQKEMLLNGWVIAMQISCICNVYESCEPWLGPALYRIGKDSLTRRLRNPSFSKIGVTPPPHPTTSFSALLICELRQSTNRWWIGLATVKTASEIRYDLVQAANNKEQIYLISHYCSVVVWLSLQQLGW